MNIYNLVKNCCALFALVGVSVPIVSHAQGDLGIVMYGPDHVTPAGAVQYSLMVTNSGPGDMTNVVVKMPTATNFTANTTVNCISGMANNGSSVCPVGTNLSISNLQGAGIVIPSIPDGGTVTIKVNGTAAPVANYSVINSTASVTAASTQTDPQITNNNSTYKTVIHSLLNGQNTVYGFSTSASKTNSPAINPTGGTFYLVYNLISGPAIPELGTTFTIPCEYSLMQNRTTNGVSYTWMGMGPRNDTSTRVFSIVPNSAGLFSNLPTANKATLPWSGSMEGDNFYRTHLSNNTLDPLGVFNIKIGQIPSLSTSSASILDSAYIKLYGGFAATFTLTSSSNTLAWGTYVSPIGQPLSISEMNSSILTVPYNNTYPFRFTAVLQNGSTAPIDFMNGGFEWADLYQGTIKFWTPNTALSVSLLDFNIKSQNDKVVLNWATVSEQQNKGFIIEKSVDGKNWSSIGFVKSLAQNGNSAQELNYISNDAQPVQGVNYYRLNQIDLDGNTNYSEVRTLTFELDNKISIFPNPVTDHINIQVSNWNNINKVKLIDVTGKVVIELNNAYNGIDISHLSNGIYQLQVEQKNGKSEGFKVIKK